MITRKHTCSCFSDFASKLGKWCVTAKESGDFFVLKLEKMKKWQIESMFWVMGDGTMTKDERNDDEGQKYE